jgi:hypothetical protein
VLAWAQVVVLAGAQALVRAWVLLSLARALDEVLDLVQDVAQYGSDSPVWLGWACVQVVLAVLQVLEQVVLRVLDVDHGPRVLVQAVVLHYRVCQWQDHNLVLAGMRDLLAPCQAVQTETEAVLA